PKDAQNTELAFFGGSFTAIDRALMAAYLKAGQAYVTRHGLRGLRLSTRPDAIDDEVCGILLSHGVTTVELGAQSMDDAVLARCERGHTAADVERAAACVKGAGMALVLQMMTGLPGDTDGGALSTARRLAALAPDGVRIYPTLVLRGSTLAKDKSYRPQTLEEAVALCKTLVEFFDGAGIPVVKLGLHAEEGYGAGELVAGPYHPAFRELVQGEIYLERAKAALAGLAGQVVLTVGRGRASQLAGQGGRNRKILAALPGIAGINIAEDPNIAGFEVVATRKT
ncbi:MAG TPA: radical SAM protein, partial [Terriglobales bacterium]|nr:radical SAM protein [Terriglobales bacterium]